MPDPVILSKELSWELQTLLYRKWAQAHDALKAIRAEKDDGSQDWQQFHSHRLQHATTELGRLTALRAEFDPIAFNINQMDKAGAST